MAREINLVPDIKNEMIKALKLRNLIFFICIIVASASIAVTFIFGAIVGGQQIAINNKKGVIDTMSDKLNSFSDRDDFLTIKDQLGNISSIIDNKKVTSRTFNILSALVPVGAPDTIQISSLNIDLAGEAPVFSFEAQANAGKAPYIDYNVLDSFKKSMKYMRYDYGNYVDKDNNNIPAYCILERDSNGAHFSDPEKGKYALWTIEEEGCYTDTDTDSGTENQKKPTSEYTTEEYNGINVVKIWRTPQAEWYNPKATNDNAPKITENGEISNVAHFDSQCINYKLIIKNEVLTKIDDTDNSCILVPGETDDDRINISNSSNGRDASGELVVRFSAVVTLAPEVYDFNNFHMLAIAPSERRNVTDSYVQLQAIFGERAEDCKEGDTACKTNGGN
ncbi:MAG: hypothetical protein Q4F61_01570 [Candidatus Saccharibacteria bacterium]|nr:hypothetical protein [Candidatus Saccharibacteria bacterium]